MLNKVNKKKIKKKNRLPSPRTVESDTHLSGTYFVTHGEHKTPLAEAQLVYVKNYIHPL